MKTATASVLGAAGLCVCLAAYAQMGPGPGPGMGMGMGAGMMGQGPGHAGVSMARHRYVMANGIPEPYASAKNPLVADAANIAAGESLFQANCASCHGVAGQGDGPAAAGLDPAPSNLSIAVHRPIASDAYLLWTMSAGGAPVHSAMPAFKDVLSRDQLWKVVIYLRSVPQRV